jgi:hypothetical protein
MKLVTKFKTLAVKVKVKRGTRTRVETRYVGSYASQADYDRAVLNLTNWYPEESLVEVIDE